MKNNYNNNNNNSKSFDKNSSYAYYQDQINFLWTEFGHEADLKDPILNCRSWETETKK